jgi:hypothetical protein
MAAEPLSTKLATEPSNFGDGLLLGAAPGWALGDPNCYHILWGGSETEVAAQVTAGTCMGRVQACAMGGTPLVCAHRLIVMHDFSVPLRGPSNLTKCETLRAGNWLSVFFSPS